MEDVEIMFCPPSLVSPGVELRMVVWETVEGERRVRDIMEGSKRSLLREVAKLLEIEESIGFRKR